MSASPLVYPPLTEDLKRGTSWRSLKYFGAGAIVASVTIASGETVFASRMGVIFGYTFLWCFLAAMLMKGIQVYTATRYMVLTGEHPMTHWAYLPGPRNWVPISIAVLSFICFPFWQAGLPLMLGKNLNWVFRIEASPAQLLTYARLWATLVIFISVGLVWFRSYAFLERAQMLIVGTLLACVLVAVVASKPDWLAVLVGMITPSVPRYDDWLLSKYPSFAQRAPWVEVVAAVGALGGGTYDYLGYVGCLREKAWGAIGRAHGPYEIDAEPPSIPLPIATSAENLARGRRWLVPTQIDTSVCFFCVLVFSICFAVLGARILRPQQLVPTNENLLNYQAQYLTNLHPGLLYVYQLGIVMAFFGTIYGAYEIYVRTAFECLMPISARFRRISFERFRRWFVVYCAVLGLILLWTSENPIEIVTPAALVGGVFTCGLWCLAMLWTDRRFLPAPLRMPLVLQVLTGISGVVLTAMGTKAIWDAAPGWWNNIRAMLG